MFSLLLISDFKWVYDDMSGNSGYSQNISGMYRSNGTLFHKKPLILYKKQKTKKTKNKKQKTKTKNKNKQTKKNP